MTANKIRDMITRWFHDESINKSEYSFTYIDFGMEKELPASSISKLEGNFMYLEKNMGEYDYVPIHRIRKILHNNQVIFSRFGHVVPIGRTSVLQTEG